MPSFWTHASAGCGGLGAKPSCHPNKVMTRSHTGVHIPWGANKYEDERVRDLPISVLVAQCRPRILAGELGAVLASHQGLHPGIITNNSHHKTNHCHYNNFMPK